MSITIDVERHVATCYLFACKNPGKIMQHTCSNGQVYRERMTSLVSIDLPSKGTRSDSELSFGVSAVDIKKIPTVDFAV